MNPARRTRLLVLARGWHLPGATTGLLAVALLLALLPALVNLPQFLVPTNVTAPTVILACLLAALLVLGTADEPVDLRALASPLHLAAIRAGRMIVMTVLALVVLSLPGEESLLSISLTLTALVGEGLLLYRVEPDLAWVLPTLHMAASATFGGTADRKVAGWAWIIASDVSAATVTPSALLFLLGLTVWSRQALTTRSAPTLIFRRRGPS